MVKSLDCKRNRKVCFGTGDPRAAFSERYADQNRRALVLPCHVDLKNVASNIPSLPIREDDVREGRWITVLSQGVRRSQNYYVARRVTTPLSARWRHPIRCDEQLREPAGAGPFADLNPRWASALDDAREVHTTMTLMPCENRIDDFIAQPGSRKAILSTIL